MSAQLVLNKIIKEWRKEQFRHERAISPEDRYLNMTESDAHKLEAKVYCKCADALVEAIWALSSKGKI